MKNGHINRIIFLAFAAFCLMFPVCANAAATSAAANYIFYPIYIVTGAITQDAGLPSNVTSEGKDVTFYLDTQKTTAKAGKGSYLINVNAIDPPALPFAQVGTTYYVYIQNSVQGNPANGYGADPVPVVLSGNGFDTVNLYYRKGGGAEITTPPVVLAEGPVILSIARATNGTDLVVSWKLNPDDHSLQGDEKVDIYALTGSDYDNGKQGWVKIVSSDILEQGVEGYTIDNTKKELTCVGQNGMGTSEAYFKAVLAGTNRNDNAKGLKKSVAVGKINVALKAGQSELVAVPLYLTDADNQIIKYDTSKLIPDQFKDGQLLYNNGGLIRLTRTNSAWDSTTGIELASGFWLMSKENATLTFIGKILNKNYNKKLAQKSELYGYPLPKSVDNTKLGIDPQRDDYVLINNGGLIRYTYDGVKWDSAFTVKRGAGFWYYNPIATERNLSVTKEE